MSPLFAFGFSTPLLLWGAALGAIPIVIHLLHRRKHREVPWAAMRFLLAAVKKNANRLRLEQLLLLMVRVLILVLLALALAQPYAESLGTYFQAEAPTQRILVIDATTSMAYRDDGETRFDRARQIAREIVEGSRQGDAFHLVRLSSAAPRAIVAQPAYQKQLVIDEIDQLPLTEQPGDLDATLQETIELLGRAPDIRRKEVYFLSDFQAATWGGAAGDASTVREHFRKLGEVADIRLIDVGEFDAPNAAIVDLASEEPFAAVGRPFGVQATVRSFGTAGPSDEGSATLDLFLDNRLAESKRVDLSTGQSRVDFQVTLATPGEHALEVRLASDALPVDNRRWLALTARDELRVLLVNGRQAGRDADNATWYIERALAPSTARQRWEGFTRPSVISESDLAATDLDGYDVVVLSNVGLFTEREADVLQSYVSGGGGLIIGLGNQVKPDNYNQMLYRGGEGVLPVRLGDRRGDARNPQDVFKFALNDLSHPIVRPFSGNPNTGLDSTLTLAYHRVAGGMPESERGAGSVERAGSGSSHGTAAPPRAVLSFDNGDPAVLTQDVGRGRVVLFTTSLDVSWSSWAVQRSFPPIIHESVRYALAGRVGEGQHLVGEPLTRTLTASASVAGTVRLPDGREESMTAGEDQPGTTLTFDGALRSGLYETVIGPPVSRVEFHAVNLDPRESNLTKLDEQQLQTEFLPEIDFEYSTRWESLDSDAGEETTVSRGGLGRWLLLATLALLLIEQVMAWNFPLGLAALGTIAGAVLVRNAWSWAPVAGIVLLVLVAAAAGIGLLRTRFTTAPAGPRDTRP